MADSTRHETAAEKHRRRAAQAAQGPSARAQQLAAEEKVLLLQRVGIERRAGAHADLAAIIAAAAGLTPHEREAFIEQRTNELLSNRLADTDDGEALELLAAAARLPLPRARTGRHSGPRSDLAERMVAEEVADEARRRTSARELAYRTARAALLQLTGNEQIDRNQLEHFTIWCCEHGWDPDTDRGVDQVPKGMGAKLRFMADHGFDTTAFEYNALRKSAKGLVAGERLRLEHALDSEENGDYLGIER
jgi:hypothetical protein